MEGVTHAQIVNAMIITPIYLVTKPVRLFNVESNGFIESPALFSSTVSRIKTEIINQACFTDINSHGHQDRTIDNIHIFHGQGVYRFNIFNLRHWFSRHDICNGLYQFSCRHPFFNMFLAIKIRGQAKRRRCRSSADK